MLYFSLWTTHRISDIESVSQYFCQTFEKHHQYDESDKSQIHSVIIQNRSSWSDKVVNVNGTQSERRMESTVSRTDLQEGCHDIQPSATLSAKTDTDLIKTSRGSFIYTPTKLHEILNKRTQGFWFNIFTWLTLH